jgi:aryl-alcohol dehydrogenase-like predicted oxidoreductase
MSSDRVVLGTASLGLNGRETAFEILDEYVRLGGRTIDTAAIYSDWVPGEIRRSEGVLGEWLKARNNRDELYIITKGAHPRIGSAQSRVDPASIRTDVDQSLERLGVDRIDLYLLHKHDPKADVAAIVGTLQDIHKQGKIRAFGSSNWPVARMNEALAVPGVTFSANQVLGNVFARLIAGPPDPTNLASTPRCSGMRSTTDSTSISTRPQRMVTSNAAQRVGLLPASISSPQSTRSRPSSRLSQPKLASGRPR